MHSVLLVMKGGQNIFCCYIYILLATAIPKSSLAITGDALHHLKCSVLLVMKDG